MRSRPPSRDPTTLSRSTPSGECIFGAFAHTNPDSRYSPRPLIIQGAGAGADVTAMGCTVSRRPRLVSDTADSSPTCSRSMSVSLDWLKRPAAGGESSKTKEDEDRFISTSDCMNADRV